MEGAKQEAKVVEPKVTAVVAYVANAGSNDVSVIDTATRWMVTVPVEKSPGDVAFTPDGTQVYVTNAGSNGVSVIDTASLKVSYTIPVGPVPEAVACSGSWVYVVNTDIMPADASISIINTVTHAMDTISLGPLQPDTYVYVAFTPDGTQAYVAHNPVLGGSSGAVSVIDTASRQTVHTISTGGQPYGIAFTPDGTRVYVTSYSDNNVSVFDATNWGYITGIPLQRGGPVGVAIASVNGNVEAYVANADNNTISVIDDASHKVVDTIWIGENTSPTYVAFTPDGTQAYVTNNASNNVNVIDTTTRQVSATIKVGEEPWGIAIASVPIIP
jgi:YVTN family beta-propeller protein